MLHFQKSPCTKPMKVYGTLYSQEPHGRKSAFVYHLSHCNVKFPKPLLNTPNCDCEKNRLDESKRSQTEVFPTAINHQSVRRETPTLSNAPCRAVSIAYPNEGYREMFKEMVGKSVFCVKRRRLVVDGTHSFRHAVIS